MATSTSLSILTESSKFLPLWVATRSVPCHLGHHLHLTELVAFIVVSVICSEQGGSSCIIHNKEFATGLHKELASKQSSDANIANLL